VPPFSVNIEAAGLVAVARRTRLHDPRSLLQLEHAVKENGKGASHSGDGLRWTKPAAKAAELRPEIALARPEGGGGHAESSRCTADDLPRSLLQNLPAA
jgi:hypothetical protein